MDAAIWSRAHGATVHFPIALALGSGVFDAAAFALGPRPLARELRAAGYWMLVLGALGSVPAVLSGLLMTRGSLLGHGALRMHHLFVWPAFALLLALAAGRICLGDRLTRQLLAVHLVLIAVTAGLMAGAGYWGGELLLTR